MILRDATPADAELLSELARRTFLETFVEGFRIPYSPDDLAAFFAEAYAPARIRASVGAGEDRWWLAEVAEGDGVVAAGFAMAGPCALPHPEASAAHGELKKLYVAGSHQGLGIGRELLDTTLAWIERAFEGPLWIGVWSGNHKAQRLYGHHGFVRVGDYEYPVGKTRDFEFILRRDRATR